MKDDFVTINEYWTLNGCDHVQVFNSSGKDITTKPPVAKFISEYKERLDVFTEDNGIPFVVADKRVERFRLTKRMTKSELEASSTESEQATKDEPRETTHNS